MINIITNNIPREIVEAWELNEAERAEFDYLDWTALERGEDSRSFARYRGELIDLHDIPRVEYGRCPAHDAFAGWDGVASDSHFSGLLVRYVADGDNERVIIGRYYS